MKALEQLVAQDPIIRGADRQRPWLMIDKCLVVFAEATVNNAGLECYEKDLPNGGGEWRVYFYPV